MKKSNREYNIGNRVSESGGQCLNGIKSVAHKSERKKKKKETGKRGGFLEKC